VGAVAAGVVAKGFIGSIADQFTVMDASLVVGLVLLVVGLGLNMLGGELALKDSPNDQLIQ
jgi:hypothetical protein